MVICMPIKPNELITPPYFCFGHVPSSNVIATHHINLANSNACNIPCSRFLFFVLHVVVQGDTRRLLRNVFGMEAHKRVKRFQRELHPCHNPFSSCVKQFEYYFCECCFIARIQPERFF